MRIFFRNYISIKFVILVFICMISQWSKAQYDLDTLKQDIELAKSDTSKVKAIMAYATELFFTKIDRFDEVLEWSEIANRLSEKKKFVDGLVHVQNLNALVYQQMNELEKAERSFKKAIKICEKHNKKLRAYQMKDNMADVLLYRGKKDEALKLKLEAYDYFEKIKDSNSMLIAQFGIGYIYQESGDLEKAKKAYLRNVNMNFYAPSMIETHGNLGIVYGKLDQLKLAEYHMTKAGKMGRDYQMFYLDNQIALAEIMQKRGKNKQALETLLEVHAMFDENSTEKSFHHLNLLIADAYDKKGDLKTAKHYLELASVLLKNGTLKQRKQVGFIGSRIFREANDFEKALYYSDVYHNSKDSMSNVQRDSSFHLIESKYNVAKKQETINAQKIKLRNFGLGLLALASVLIIGGLWFYNSKKKQKLKEEVTVQESKAKEAEIEVLKKENKLISMHSMLEGQEEERKRIAQDLHDNIGTLMTSIKIKFLSIQEEIESINKMNIADELDGMINSASQEVRRISHRMTPNILEHAGLHDSIQELEIQLTDNNIIVKSDLEALKTIEDKKLELNIYRIVQETYTNIIKHSEASSVSIVSEIRDASLVLRIRDNGKGITTQKWEDKNTLGLNGIKSRVNYINGEITLVADDGAHFKITIPLA